jgi:uncharacterized membrane protein HdeD (DUF308 family)
MSDHMIDGRPSTDPDRWLKSYYALRGAISIAWVAAALTVGPKLPLVAAVLLVIYPAWDAVANVIDARRNGGLRRNPTQLFNTAVSGLTTVAVAVALSHSMHAVLGVFGVWAALSGLLQLATAVRRRKHAGGQWVMVISGVQSAAAGANFLRDAGGTALPSVTDIAPYAAFGAFYFLVSAAWLSVVAARRRRSADATAGR